MMCPECGSTNLIRSYDRGELTCMDCGLVIDEKIIDQGPEWRAFTPEEKEERVRCAPLRGRRDLFLHYAKAAKLLLQKGFKFDASQMYRVVLTVLGQRKLLFEKIFCGNSMLHLLLAILMHYKLTTAKQVRSTFGHSTEVMVYRWRKYLK